MPAGRLELVEVATAGGVAVLEANGAKVVFALAVGVVALASALEKLVLTGAAVGTGELAASMPAAG